MPRLRPKCPGSGQNVSAPAKMSRLRPKCSGSGQNVPAPAKLSRLRPKCSGSGQNVPAPALAPQHWLAGNVLLGEDEGQVFLPEAGQRGRHHAAAHHHHKLLNLIIIYKQLVYGTYNVINLNLLCVICIQKIIEEGQLLRYKENGQNFSQVL